MGIKIRMKTDMWKQDVETTRGKMLVMMYLYGIATAINVVIDITNREIGTMTIFCIFLTIWTLLGIISNRVEKHRQKVKENGD